VDHRRNELATYWANGLVGTSPESIDDLMNKIELLRDHELSTYLLSHVVERARLINQAKLWHEAQSHAWEAEAKKSLLKKVFGR
jgi:hypothetical protein